MNIQLVKQFARLDISSIAEDVINQWQKQGAVKKDELIFVGVQQENGRWYITFRVEDNKKHERDNNTKRPITLHP